jgi:GTP-binding protein
MFRSQSAKNPFKDRKFHTPSRLRKHKEKNTGQ